MSQSNQTKSGVFYALGAYGMWGFAPIYFKHLSVVSAADILVHRILWSSLLLAALVLLFSYKDRVKRAFASPRIMLTLLIAGALLAGNWLLFIWAVNHDFLLEASLGYYINPLVNIALGAVILGERFRRAQLLSIFIALAGVVFLVFSYGEVPWIALLLAFSFSVYGLLRKKAAVDSLPGLLIETCLMLPLALVYALVFGASFIHFASSELSIQLLLLCAGVVTIAPLLCFTAAAKRLQYSTLGFFQYIGPSIMFVLATYLYDEPLSNDRLITFACVWTALLIYSIDSWRHYHKQRKLRKVATIKPR